MTTPHITWNMSRCQRVSHGSIFLAYRSAFYNLVNLWHLSRAIPLAPFWLRGILISLTRLYQPIFRLQPSDLYRNYDAFAKTNASLACLVMMSDRLYENYLIDPPAHTLEWDMAGSMRVVPDAALVLEGEEALKLEGGEALVLEGGEALVLEGGEIKSCFRGKNSVHLALEIDNSDMR
jgi:hypothetical protein